MKYNNYTIDQVEVDDEVYFDSTPAQDNHDLYWKVIKKLEKENRLIVRLNEMGYVDERWVIDVSAVKYRTPIAKQRTIRV